MSTGPLTSLTDNWETPQLFFEALDAEFGFTLDVCANADNAKCSTYFDVTQDGLRQDWRTTGAVWMNPPYGRTISKWIAKAYATAQHGQTVVCLVPARTDTAWWHDYCAKGEVRFIRGRIRFGNATSGAPFPSAVVIFRGVEVEK